MWSVFVRVFVTIFIPKKHRASVKYNLLGGFNKLRVYHRAKFVGKDFCCGEIPVRVNKNTIIMDNVGINGLSILGSGNVTIGSNCRFGTELMIISDSHNYEGEYIPYDSSAISKDVVIGDFVWCGARVTILPGTNIGEGAIIQACSVVHGEIPPYAIAGGNPAKVFKYRNKEHFEKLKKEQKILH